MQLLNAPKVKTIFFYLFSLFFQKFLLKNDLISQRHKESMSDRVHYYVHLHHSGQRSLGGNLKQLI
jgi:hypothetical protein